jgi:RNA 3'-terminal phosphate cyclase
MQAVHQYVCGLQVAAMCRGDLLGGAVGSGCVRLTPRALTGGCYTADTRTAGSCMLLAQA